MSIIPDLKPPPQPTAAEWVADADRAYDAIPRLPLFDDAECWSRMPAAAGEQGPLPNWARALAGFMPHTAAAMFVLDHAQRTRAPLDPVLRAKIRWVVALANRSVYGMAYAAADLGQAGASDADLATLADPEHAWDSDREALAFARQLAMDPSAVGDGQFASLVEQYGERSVAAMVLVTAYGCFQDRLTTSLNLPVEKEGPLPPLAVRFLDSAFALAPAPKSAKPTANHVGGSDPAVAVDPRWVKWDDDGLQEQLARRRQCRPRLAIPSWTDVKPSLPPEYPTQQPVFIRWALVSMGYVPELALPWNAAARMYWVESALPPKLEAGLLWIQSRVLECSYGMGHAQMLLELVDASTAGERTRALARGDWSDFPIQDQLAFAFACLLTSAPWEVSDSDVECLACKLGPQHAVHAIWWLCRGLYLCRIADAFGLPLERDNVLIPAGHTDSLGDERARRCRAWKTA